MAVIQPLPGLKVSVCIGDKPVQEYADDDENEPNANLSRVVADWQAARTVSRYIESISDTEFSIEIILESPFKFDCPSLLVEVLIDGKRMDAPLFTRKGNGPYKDGCFVIKSMLIVSKVMTSPCPGRSDQMFIQNYKFAKIETRKYTRSQ